MKRRCQFCGNEWKTGEPIPCRCYKQVPDDIVVKGCPLTKRRSSRNLQVCYTCDLFEDCSPREKAQVDKLLATEKPKKRRATRVKRGWRGA
jgi:hypothetical protein